ncbi:MAG: 16S rRNA (guanine(966)-N(2))-methyltransferase RsmD [Oscillospiraceae bacterium]
MRVITGLSKGRKLESPRGTETRPTSEMTKEAVFSMIQFEIEDAVFGDFFAGSGQMGVEALSRGAKQVVFVENARDAINVVRNNVTAVDGNEISQIITEDIFSYIKTCNIKFDIVFLDPPYKSGILPDLLPLTAYKMSGGGIIICETERTEDTPDDAGEFQKVKETKYGKAKISCYRKK